jgi:molybdate transport system substrate-binding protein
MLRRTVLALFLGLAAPGTAAAVPTVAAAADLRFAMDELVQAYAKRTGRSVRVTFGSSGIFYQQLLQGAPFELFLSADEDYVVRLFKAGKTQDSGTLYAIGRIVLVAPASGGLAVDSQLDGLRRALDMGAIRRFAIASPDHAPYGMRAREALQHSGLWQRLESRLVHGENVAQALQFVTTGAADGGVVALSLIKSPTVAGRVRAALIPQSWHRPLRQRMVLTADAGPEARLFYQWLQTPPARAILVRHGFALPGEPA